MAVAAEQVHRFVHAVTPCPRGENLHTVILHGAEERCVYECRHHGIVVEDACFGNAECDAVILAEVFFEPLVDAHENVLLGDFIVPVATDHLYAVCAWIVIGRVKQDSMPVHA